MMRRQGLKRVYIICLSVLVLLFITVVFTSITDKNYGVGALTCLLFLVGYWLIDKYGPHLLRSTWFRWLPGRRRHKQ